MAMKNPRQAEENHKLCLKLEASYIEILKETFMLLVGVLGTLTDHEVCSNGTDNSPVGNVASWKDTLQIMNLKLDDICAAGEKICILVVCAITFTLFSYLYNFCYTISFVIGLQQRLLVDYKPQIRTSIEVHLMHLHAWLGVILSSAEGILSELLEAHRTVSISCLDELSSCILVK